MEKQILSKSRFHEVIALSETEIGKIVFSDQFSLVDVNTGVNLFPDAFKKDIDREIQLLKYANHINDLMVKYIRTEEVESKKMMVMERVYGLPLNHFDSIKRKSFFKEFEEKLLELHDHGFAHGDIEHPRIYTEERFDNIILTIQGFRLIDTGFSVLESDSPTKFFHTFKQDRRELRSFEKFFLELE
jgi:serine/threonine protein kinase